MQFTIEVTIKDRLYNLQITFLGVEKNKERFLVKAGNSEKVLLSYRLFHNEFTPKDIPVLFIVEGDDYSRFNENVSIVGTEIEKYMRDNGHWW